MFELFLFLKGKNRYFRAFFWKTGREIENAVCLPGFIGNTQNGVDEQKNTADKSDTQQGIDIAAYEKKLADNRENYKLGCEQYSTDTDTVKTRITGIYRLQTALLKICRKRMSCMSWRVEYTALLHRRAGIQ